MRLQGQQRSQAVGVRVINVDSLSELKRVVSLVRDTDLRVNVGFRFSYPGRSPSKNKFGITAEQILDGCRMISKERRIHYAGLHTHIGTETTEIGKYEKAVELLTDLASSIYRKYGFQTEIIDLGGGFAFKEVAPYSHRGRWSPPSFSEYASRICSKLTLATVNRLPSPPTLALEPGRALVGPTGIVFISNVLILIDMRHQTFPKPIRDPLFMSYHTLANLYNKPAFFHR